MWYNDYVGIPFLAKGRDSSGLDCWGLVRLVYKEEFDIELPSFSDDYEYDDTERIEQLTAQYKEGWEEVSSPKPGSIVLFKVLGHLSHIGIYIGGNKFLHCLENHSSVIENLDSINWNKRFAGFFNYVEKSAAVLNAVPHPLRTERWTVPAAPGTTIEQLSGWVLEQFGVSKELDSSVTIIRNGVVVPKEAYSTTVVLDHDTIEYRAIPGKSFLKIALLIAVAFAAPYLAGVIAPGLTGAGLTALTAGIATVGQLLIGYLMPVRPPTQKDPGTAASQLLLSGGSNQVSKYAAIPVVLGKVRMTPLLGGENYIESNTDNSYLNMLLVWGFGPLDIDKATLRIGLNPFTQYENGAGIPIEHYHLNDAVTADDNSDKLNFNAIYGSDRQQVFPGNTLRMSTSPVNVNVDGADGFGAVGPWIEATLNQPNTVRIDVNIHFPQGLRQLRVKGKSAGDINDLEAKFQVQVQSVDQNGANPSAWGSATRATIPATTIIAQRSYDTLNNPRFRWTRIGIGNTGIQVKVGPRCATQTAASGIGAYATVLGPYAGGGLSDAAIAAGATVADIGVRLPAWDSSVTPLADVCMNGDTLVATIDYGVALRANSTITGMTITDGPIASINYEIINWAVPFNGANTGDRLITIAQGTIARSTNTVVSLGTGASGLFRSRKDAFSYTVSTLVASLPNNGYYRVRVRRLTDDNEDDADLRNKRMHTMVFQTATATATNKPIVEGTNWRLTKSAIRIKANDQLNSRIEGVNAIVTTICPDWNPATSTWVNRATNNPASLFLYILTHRANAYRIADADLNLKVNRTALEAWHVFCKANGFTFNSVVSSQVSVLDILRDICAAGRASPAMVDGKWTVIIDEVKPDIVQHFTPHNSWGFEASKRLPKKPHALRINYLDANSDYEESEAFIYNAGYGAAASTGIEAAEIFEQINLPGITDYETVKKHGRWHLAQATLRPEIYTINTDFEYLVCNRGDRVKVMHDVPLWGLASGRIRNRITTSVPTSITGNGTTATATVISQDYALYAVGTSIVVSGSSIAGYNGTKTVTACTLTTVSWLDATTGIASITGTGSITSADCSVFEVDEDIPLEASVNDSYTIRVRSKTGGTNTWNVNKVSTNGYYSTIQISQYTTAPASAPAKATTAQIDNNDLFMIGTLNQEAQDLLVLAIEPYGNQNAKITLVDYAPDLFGAYTDTFTVPAYTSKITLPSKNLVQSIPYKPIITSIISDETVMEQVASGSFKINIKIGFTNPAGLPTDIEHVVAEIDDVGDSLDNWQTTVPVLLSKQTFTISGVDELRTYRVRLRYVSKDGRTGPWQTAITSAVTSTSWSSGVLTINTLSRHSFSVGTQVYLYNAQGTSLNNIYTVDSIPTRTSLSFAITKPTTAITTTATTARAGLVTAAYTDKNYTPYLVGSQILVTGAVPSTYNGMATVTACDSAGVSWSTGNILTYTEDMRNTVEAGGSRPWTQFNDGDTQVTNEVAIPNSQGVNGVSKLQLATTGNVQRQTSQSTTLLADNTVITISIEAKAVELSTINLILSTKVPDYPTVTFNLATGTVTTVINGTTNSVLNYGIVNLSNGWYRCWMSASVGTGVSNPGIVAQLPTVSGTAGQGIYVSRAQINLGAYPGAYIPVLAATGNVLPITATTQATITPCVTTTAITQATGVATATFAAQKYLSFAIGSSITITGATPAGFNGTFVITAATATTVSWALGTTATATVQGTIVRTPNVGSWTTSTANQANQDLTTGQGLVSSKDNLNNNFLAENLQHRVIGKTSPPDTVVNFTVTPNSSLGLLNLNWTANQEIDVQYYEVRTDTNWGAETNRIFYGAGLTCTAVPAALGVARTYYIKAIDYSLNYSNIPASASYTVVVPPTVTTNPIATFLYNTTSLTDTNVIFNWTAPAGSAFLIDRYELTLVKPSVGTLVQEVNDTTWSTPANWVGNGTLTIKSIDILGNKSVSSASLTVTKNLPQSVSAVSITTTPVGTNLSVSWAEVATGTSGMAVAGYEIRTADSNWGNAGMLYSGSSNSATFDIKGTASGTTLTYFIRTYDVDNRYSAASTSFTYTVAAPVNTSWAATPFVFGENSLTAATVTLNWNPATPVFGLYGYELSYTTTAGVAVTRVLNTTSITVNTSAVWTTPATGTVVFTIRVIDNLGIANKSSGVTTSVQKFAPGAITNFTAKVIDNNVLLSWTPPAKTTLPIDRISVYKGDINTNIGDKTGTFTTVLEQTGGTFTYLVAAVDTDGQMGPTTSLTATVSQPPDYVFNAAYSSIFANINTTVTNTQLNSTNITVGSSEGMLVGMQIILSGTVFGGLTAGYWYVVSIVDTKTITISSSSALTPIFTASSTASGTMTLIDATGAEGQNSNALYDNQGIVMPVNTTETFTQHFVSGTGRTWTGPSDQNTYFPIFIQPGAVTGFYEEVYNYTKTLASSQITLNYNGTSFNAPAITPTISTAGSVSGGAVTVTNAANSTAVTSSTTSVGLVVGNFITIPANTGQTVRVTAVAGTSVTVSPAIVAANTGVTFSYAGAWTNYTGTSALGIAFQYVKARISVGQATRNGGLGTISAPGGTNTTVTVTGAGGSLFTRTFKVGDVMTIPNTAIGVDYAVASVTSDTVLAVTVPAGVTMPVHSAGTTYAYKGTDLYKLTALGVKLDAKQKTQSGMVTALSTDTLGTIVNFTTPFIDVSSINLSAQGTTTAPTCIYNFYDTNTTGTYTVSGTPTCIIDATAHGLVANTQLANITFTSGTAPSGVYPITLVNANRFSIELPAALTTSGAVSVYPNSMTVYAYTSGGARFTPNPSVSWTVRGF